MTNLIGGVALNVGRVIIPEYDPEEDPDVDRCMVCDRSARRGARGGRHLRLLDFELRFRPPNRPRARRVGVIRLCERCWRRCA